MNKIIILTKLLILSFTFFNENTYATKTVCADIIGDDPPVNSCALVCQQKAKMVWDGTYQMWPSSGPCANTYAECGCKPCPGTQVVCDQPQQCCDSCSGPSLCAPATQVSPRAVQQF